MRSASLAVPLAGLLLLAGCGGGGNQPSFGDLSPVTGTVSAGGKAAGGGVIVFASDPPKADFLINSEVGPDGRFELSTVRTTDSTGERKKGAPPGKYKVTFTPKLGDQTAGYKEPVTLPAAVTVEAKANDLKIELPTKK